MKCYNHPDRDAVKVTKEGYGLCGECADADAKTTTGGCLFALAVGGAFFIAMGLCMGTRIGFSSEDTLGLLAFGAILSLPGVIFSLKHSGWFGVIILLIIVFLATVGIYYLFIDSF